MDNTTDECPDCGCGVRRHNAVNDNGEKVTAHCADCGSCWKSAGTPFVDAVMRFLTPTEGRPQHSPLTRGYTEAAREMLRGYGFSFAPGLAVSDNLAIAIASMCGNAYRDGAVNSSPAVRELVEALKDAAQRHHESRGFHHTVLMSQDCDQPTCMRYRNALAPFSKQ